MAPLIALSVLAALLLAQRSSDHNQRKLVRFGVTAVLIVVIASAVTMAEVALRAFRYASGLVLITNLVLVAWALALRGGRLWVSNVETIPSVEESNPLTVLERAPI